MFPFPRIKPHLWAIQHHSLCFPTRGTHRDHCSSFGFPLNSLGSPTLITQQRPLGQMGPFQRRIRAHLTIVKRTLSFSLFSSPAEQSCTEKEKQSQVLCPKQREGPRGADSEHGLADPPASLSWTVKKVWRDEADKQGQAGQQTQHSLPFWIPQPGERRRAIEFCSTTPRSLSFSRFSVVRASLPMPHK